MKATEPSKVIEAVKVIEGLKVIEATKVIEDFRSLEDFRILTPQPTLHAPSRECYIGEGEVTSAAPLKSLPRCHRQTMYPFEYPSPKLDQAEQTISWLWHGILAPGKITLLTSQWKTGKTTLLGILLAHRHRSEALAGLAVAPGMTVVVSEETPDLWARRKAEVDFGPRPWFFCRPFKGPPMPADQQLIVDRLTELRASDGLDLVVIDPLVAFLPPDVENLSGALLKALAPLRQLAELGLAVLLLHHPRKGAALAGQLARGSGALSAFADIVVEMHLVDHANCHDRRRRLLAQSRFRETPRLLLIELTEDGRTYNLLPETATDEFASDWSTLKLLLEEAPHELTRNEILAEWPPDFPKPTPHTLWRWLGRAFAEGLVARSGSGKKHDLYRYWLPERMAHWEDDGDYQVWKMLEQTKDTSFLKDFGKH